MVSACGGQKPQDVCVGRGESRQMGSRPECPVRTTWHPPGPAGQRAHSTPPPGREGGGEPPPGAHPPLPHVNSHSSVPTASRQAPCIPHLRNSPGEVGDPRITGCPALRPPAVGLPGPPHRPGGARGTRVQKTQRARRLNCRPGRLHPPHVSALLTANFPRAVAVCLAPWSPAVQPGPASPRLPRPGVGSARLSATLSSL
uniref:Uncharacterized protein n=1 Tax=Rousettus aegyptiacus TaxID=9407 RepID=A0A7J8FIN7_ROUAE|nr:hypothetical protein HJG63_012027 [Rousettus aegyptiacus]